MGRAPCCDKANVKKGPWSPEEDAKLKSYIEQHGTGGNWIALPQKIGLKRCGKSCRLRWLNYLRPNIKHGGFSEEEDRVICSLYVSIGSRWSIIAAQLPGRTDNDIKNYWNTRLKKKLFGKQRKEATATTKRTMKKSENNDNNNAMFSVNNNTHQNLPYWPQIPIGVTKTPQYNNNDQAAASINPIENNLSKMEESSSSSAQFAGDQNLYDHHHVHGCDGMINFPFLLQGQTSYYLPAPELENYNNMAATATAMATSTSTVFNDPAMVRQKLDGLEFLFGDEMSNVCNNVVDHHYHHRHQHQIGSELGENELATSLICPSNYEELLQGLTSFNEN